jgi:hypothetical protein
MKSTLRNVQVAGLAAVAIAGLAWAQPGDQPVMSQPAAIEPAGVAASPEVDAVLTRLESADRNINTMQAKIRYIKNFPKVEGGGQHARYGTIIFNRSAIAQGAAAGKTVRQFAVLFDSLVLDGTRKRDEKREFVFDGAVLIEKRHDLKEYERYIVANPGDEADPLRIGEGPFPVPIGQRKADLVARFDVTIASPLENAPESPRLRDQLATCTQLKLIPKPATRQAKDFSEIRLWYRNSDNLPIFAQTVNPDGSSSEVFLVDVQVNTPVPATTFNTALPPASEGWKGKEEDIRGRFLESK